MTDDLYREICRTPGDDTLRLAYADWLDEQPTSRPCARCEGTGYGVKTGAYSWRVCDCGGGGSVVDRSNQDRAEFIRVQHEREPLTRDCSFLTDGLDWHTAKRVETSVGRERELTEAHPEWSRCPCRSCFKRGGRFVKTDGGYDSEWVECPACNGTGDLFLAPGVSGASLTPPPKPRTVTFARGFPDSVSCTLGEAFAEDGTPTPWACEVVRRTPVTRFVLTDKTPAWDRHGDGVASWYNGTEVLLPSVITAAVPGILLSEMTGEISVVAPPRLGKWFHDVPAAADALAVAAGRLVRRHVYGEVTA